jgi:hypothetical protein
LLGPRAPDSAYTLEHYAKLLRRLDEAAEAQHIEARLKYIRAEQKHTVSREQLRVQ